MGSGLDIHEFVSQRTAPKKAGVIVVVHTPSGMAAGAGLPSPCDFCAFTLACTLLLPLGLGFSSPLLLTPHFQVATREPINCTLCPQESGGDGARTSSLSERWLLVEGPEVPGPDAQFLLQLSGNITDDPDRVLANWGSPGLHACSWAGVICDQSYRVRQLNLSGHHLGGFLSSAVGNLSTLTSLDMSINNLTGRLPQSLGWLSTLQHLDLSYNNFAGSIPDSLSECRELAYVSLAVNSLTDEIPASLGQLRNLTQLYLSNNDLSGSIPPAIGTLFYGLVDLTLFSNLLSGPVPYPDGTCSNLVNLELQDNMLTGAIPPYLGNCTSLRSLLLSGNRLTGSIPAELAYLSQLQYLLLNHNQLTGIILPVAANLTALYYLDLSNNSLSGFIPEVWSTPNLQTLILSSNQLTGGVPSGLGSLTNLNYLGLNGNRLTGDIPLSLFDCTSLETLLLARNQLQGTIPPELGNSLLRLTTLFLHENSFTGIIPESIRNCTGLAEFSVNSNPGLSGPIPSWLGELENLTALSLFNCNFYGPFPNLSGNSMLQYLYLTDNQLGDRIPNDVGKWWPNIISIYAGNNGFTGEIPTSLGLSGSLQILSLTGNRLTGGVPPQLGNLVNLGILDLSRNNLNGSLPSIFGSLTQLQRLRLGNNQLEGPIPDLSNCRELGELDLSSNAFTGAIPSWIGLLNMTLFQLSLRDNQLTDVIPDELGSCSNLQELDLSSNQLSGGIPWPIAAFSKQTLLNLSHNSLSGALPPQFGSLTLVQIIDLSYNQLSGGIPQSLSGCTALQTLDLSNNKLDGAIPASLGEKPDRWLASVMVIDFSVNSLNGSIPQELGNLETLTSLDLSYNHLSGEIPESLAKLVQLTFLNLSVNQLSGPVPTTGMFLNLTDSSYLDNPGLCGEVLHRSCSRRRGLRIWMIVVLSVGAGAGFFVLCCSYVVFCWCRCSLSSRGQALEDEDEILLFDTQLALSSVSDLWAATEGFSDAKVIGVGSVSIVYKGTLADGRQIAVKKMKGDDFKQDERMSGPLLTDKEEEMQRSFVMELKLLGQLRHRNLIKLLASQTSASGQVRSMVLEYMERGSLAQALHPSPTWDGQSSSTASNSENSTGDSFLGLDDRLSIALDVAQGLLYLHDHGVIHCDLKPANILLDSDRVAHIGDFGIAKLLYRAMGEDNTSVSSVMASKFRGSFGYMAPEYVFSLRTTTAGDVYSFGVVVMEMLTGKRPTDSSLDGLDLPAWTSGYFAGRSLKVFDTILLESASSLHETDKLFPLLRVALLCAESKAENRPNMRQVIPMLEEIRIRPNSGGDAEELLLHKSLPTIEQLAHTPSVW